MGNIEEAIKCFIDHNQLGEKLYKSNTANYSLKQELAFSYGILGELYEELNYLEVALMYFEKYNQFGKELYDVRMLI